MSANARITDDDSITFRVDGVEIAKFEDNGNGMEGFVCEGNTGKDPARLEASDICALAAWLLLKAEERASRLELQ